MIIEEPQITPTKWVTKLLKVNLNCDVKMVDFEERSDERSIQNDLKNDLREDLSG